MDLNEILVFAKVVELGSFVGAARELDIPKSTVSRRVAELEQRLGARLLQRTTRKLSLTDVGHAYYRHAARVVAEVAEAERAVTDMQEVPRGLLRASAPLSFRHLGPIVAAFLIRHPEMQVELVCADRRVDLIQEGFDVAIRAGRLADSSLIARSLGSLSNLLVATPAFLKKHGAPSRPEDLQDFACIAFGGGQGGDSWKLFNDGSTTTVRVKPRLVVNEFELLHDAVLGSLGIAMLPIDRCAGDLRDKRLRRVLPDWCTPESPVHVVYPSTRHLSPKVKAFVDHLLQSMSPPPWTLSP